MTTYNGQGITNGAFLVSWDYSNITNDTFGLVSSNPDSGDGMNEKRARQRLGPDIGGTWARVHTGIYNSLNADVFLLPVINDAPVVGLEAPKFKGLTVLGNYPNPANSESNIRFSLDDEKVVSLKVFDTHGRNIADINQSFSAGDHLFTIDMTPYAAGNYYYTLKVEGQSFTAKINVIK